LATDVFVLLPTEAVTSQLSLKPLIRDGIVQQFALVEHIERAVPFSNDFPNITLHRIYKAGNEQALGRRSATFFSK
jgi:hypothetical protein